MPPTAAESVAVDAAPAAPSPRWVRWLLTLIVLGSVASCAWFASSQPGPERVWDERYSVWNVAKILRTGDLRPAWNWYPSLSHLPQAAVLAAVREVHELTGAESLTVLSAKGRFTPTAYRVSRWVNVLYGAVCLLLTFVLSRRLFSAEVGLLAAFFLATAPWFVRAAGIYKPDPLLMLLTLVAFLWALRAAERGTLGSYLLAGAGVGLAASSKQNGALACIPLVAATAWSWRDRSRWLWLGGAGLASVAVFLLLNPYPRAVARYLAQRKIYARWSARQPEGEPMALFVTSLPMDDTWHGAVVGAAAVLGIVGLVVVLIRKRSEPARAVPLAVFLSLPIVFPLLAAVVSSGVHRRNAFIQLLPFTAITAAWFLNAAWAWARGRLPGSWRGVVLWPVLIALVALQGWRAADYVYSQAVTGTTLTRARSQAFRHAPSPRHRSVVFEGTAHEVATAKEWVTRGHLRAWAQGVPSLREVSAAALDRYDYEIFPEARLEGPEAELYRGRMERVAPERTWTVEPRALRTRGASQVVVAHPWHLVPPVLPVEWRPAKEDGDRRLTAALPRRLKRGQLVSLNLRLATREAKDCRLELRTRAAEGGAAPSRAELELFLYKRGGGRARWMTERFPLDRRRGKLTLECATAKALGSEPKGSVWRWSDTPPRRRR